MQNNTITFKSNELLKKGTIIQMEDDNKIYEVLSCRHLIEFLDGIKGGFEVVASEVVQ